MLTPETERKSDITRYETIRDHIRIINILRPILERHSIIEATIVGFDQTYKTTLLSIDTDKNELTIAELNAEKGNEAFRQIKKITLHGILEGVGFNFTVGLKHLSREKDGHYFNLEFPEYIRYFQRRNAFRVVIKMQEIIHVDILLTNGETFPGELVDISASGMLVRFCQNNQKSLEVLATKTQCFIYLPNNECIQCFFK
jgi:c-di-GMP-binding flagellar brake protein YcgR